ncbi:MAG: YbhB/YbcL family Raf kinase inhibitor-like protein [Deltaproteobacteria bacterium]|nr:MAG: YbhB/YbcL family Raf kinase inhibitor-like protein [Deltaproteobacteria bacterium]
MKLWSESFEDGGRLPEKFAMGKRDPDRHAVPSDNLNPHLAWSDLPAGTRSLAIVCVDPCAPTDPTHVNKPGVTVPRDLPRAPFYHWVLIDLPADAAPIAEGEFSRGVTPRGKGPDCPRGRHGINDYTMWFEGDADMAGDYYGYDGPWPPFNDELVHRYEFTVYALDVDRLDVPERFRAPDAFAAMEGHVLDKATVTGLYAINPDAS